MTNDRLSPDAVKRVSGAAWEMIRPLFFQMSDVLLDTHPDCAGVLTTIYVKYQISGSASSPVFAVAWLRSSQLVLGLALPDTIESRLLGPPPKGMTYKGLTKYLTLKPGDSLPTVLSDWARVAYEHVLTTEE